MQSYEWVRTWAEFSGLDRDLEILVSGDPPEAIAPLIRSRAVGRRLELVAPDTLGEAMDFVYSEGASVSDIAAFLAKSRAPVRLWRIPLESPAVDALRQAYRWRGIVRCRPTAGIPSLPLDRSWVNPEDRLDRHRRSNVRRARRIADEMGPVTCEILSPTESNVGTLLDEAYAVEAAGWKARRGEPLARDVVGDFFRRYATEAARKAILRVCFLRIGGRVAAMKLGAIVDDRFWLISMGFAEEFERCSPGTLLLLETIRHAARSGLRSYEFLGADEPWIHALGAVLRPCVQVRTYPFGLRGAIALASDFGAVVETRARALGAATARLPGRIEERMALAYVAGPTLENAVHLGRLLAEDGLATTMSYVPADSDAPARVAQRYLATIDAIPRERLDSYASVKAPPLEFSHDLFREIAERAAARRVDLHFDALSAESTDQTFALIREVRAVQPAVGCTLPGRWRRSVRDADRAVELDLAVRVVKGEWADPREAEPDPTAGFLAVVDRIAGRVRRAAVATHDPALAREALRRLRAAGTPSELEVLWGYPYRRVLPVAADAGVAVRVYVPFGHLELPYSRAHAKDDPRVVGWAMRDLVRAGRSKDARIRPGGTSE